MSWELFDLNDAILYLTPELKELVMTASQNRRDGGKVLLRRLSVNAGATMAEIRTNYTTVFNGAIAGAAPSPIDFASTDAGDNDKTVTRLVIDENNEIVEETTTIAAQASAGVVNCRRLNDARMSAVAAGTVTAHEDGATVETYATIAVAAAFTVNARFYVPDGKQGVQVVKASYKHPAAAAGYLTTNGVLVMATNSQHPVYDMTQTMGPGNHDICTCPTIITGNNDRYFSVQVQAVDTDIATPVDILQTIIVW